MAFFSKLMFLKSHLNTRMSLFVFSNVVSILLTILTIKLLTNKFSTADFGDYSLIMAIAAFPQVVLFSPLSASIFPFFKKMNINDNYYLNFQKDIFDIFFLFILILFSLIILCFFLNQFFSFINLHFIFLFILSICFSASISSLTILDSFSLASSNVKEFTLFPIINLTLKLLLILIIFKIKMTPTILIWFFCAVHFILFIFQAQYLKNKNIITYIPKFKLRNVFTISTPIKSEIFIYGKNFFIWGLFTWAQSFFDKWFLNKYSTPRDVGVYAVYFQYGFFPFTVFSSIISQYITPIYYSKIDENEALYKFMKNFIFFLIFFLSLSILILPLISYYIAPPIIKTLTNSNYLLHIKHFPYIVLAGCFYCFGQIGALPLLNAKLVKQVRFPKIASSILAVLLFWYLVPNLGILGIILSLVIINIFYCAIIYIFNINYFLKLRPIKISSELKL